MISITVRSSILDNRQIFFAGQRRLRRNSIIVSNMLTLFIMFLFTFKCIFIFGFDMSLRMLSNTMKTKFINKVRRATEQVSYSVHTSTL